MMKQPTKDGFAQKKIGSKKPDGFSDNPIRAQVTLALEQRGRAINLIMVAGKACDEPALDILRQTKEGEFYLAIEKDTIISFALSDKIDWRWNQKQAALTTKDDRESLYAVDGGFDDPLTGEIQFYCKARGGDVPQTDGLSIAVDLQQSGGSYLPIIIDPDIRNPPPGGG
jgi:hypothetical protein